ncbi:MAG: DUF429 domain-containing protein, partial [Actinomycetota bacterium]
PKIAELDRVLRERNGEAFTICEVHPEVAFRAWNDGVPMAHSKKAPEGAAARRALIDAWLGESTLELARGEHPKKDLADDDILDAVDRHPPDRPVTVVSDDRRVQDGARERGANVVPSTALLEAL